MHTHTTTEEQHMRALRLGFRLDHVGGTKSMPRYQAFAFPPFSNGRALGSSYVHDTLAEAYKEAIDDALKRGN